MIHNPGLKERLFFVVSIRISKYRFIEASRAFQMTPFVCTCGENVLDESIS